MNSILSMGKIINMYFWIPARAVVSRDAENRIIEKLLKTEEDLTLAIFEQENGYYDKQNFRFAVRIGIDEDDKAIFQTKWTEITEIEYYNLRGVNVPT